MEIKDSIAANQCGPFFRILLVLDLHPMRPTAWAGRGDAYRLKGDTDLAINDYTRAIEFSPDNFRARYGRGLANRQRGSIDAAIEDLSWATKLDPTSEWAWTALGAAYVLSPDLDQAVLAYSRAIELDHADAVAWAGRGDAHRLKWEPVEAIADYSSALELDPDMGPAWCGVGEAKQLMGDRDGALAAFDKAFRLDPENWIAAWGKSLAELPPAVIGSNDSEGHSAAVNCLAIEPSGAWFASASDDGTVKLWSLDDCRLLRTLEGHASEVQFVSISPNGALIAAMATDGMIRIWNGKPGDSPIVISMEATEPTLQPQAAVANWPRFSEDGRSLAASHGTNVRVWDTLSGDLISETSVGGLFGGEAGDTHVLGVIRETKRLLLSHTWFQSRELVLKELHSIPIVLAAEWDIESGALVETIGEVAGMQGAPLITDDWSRVVFVGQAWRIGGDDIIHWANGRGGEERRIWLHSACAGLSGDLRQNCLGDSSHHVFNITAGRDWRDAGPERIELLRLPSAFTVKDQVRRLVVSVGADYRCITFLRHAHVLLAGRSDGKIEKIPTPRLDEIDWVRF